MNKPLCVYITGAKSYDSGIRLRLEFDDRLHYCYAGALLSHPHGWACGLQIAKVALNYPVEFSHFLYLLARVRTPTPLPAEHMTSCHPVWATTDKVCIGNQVFDWQEVVGPDGIERLRVAYEDFWDARLTSHN